MRIISEVMEPPITEKKSNPNCHSPLLGLGVKKVPVWKRWALMKEDVLANVVVFIRYIEKINALGQ